MVTKTETTKIVIKPLNWQNIVVPIEGVTELIVHNWDEKAIGMIKGKVTGKKQIKAREVRIPENDYEASKYKSIDGWEGVPAGNFKAAMCEVCNKDNGFPRTQAKMAIYVKGDGLDAKGQSIVKIIGAPRMREDMVRVGMGAADIRWRAGYPKWSATLRIDYDADILDEAQIVNLVNRAGMLSGICEGRPSSQKSCSQNYGMFQVKVSS
jgi:hypothetical protein